MTTDDSALLARYAASRDAEAFAALVGRYAGMVHGTCLRILGDSHAAEDVAQECFMELATKAGAVTRSLPGWLHAIATSRSLDAMRSAARRRKREEGAVLNEEENTAPTWEAVAPVIDQALDQLPEDLRNPLVLHYLQGKDQTEVAEKLGISQSTVSRRLETGVDELRRKLQKAGIVASVALLANLLSAHAATAAPAVLVAALGKMAMAGIGQVAGTASAPASVAIIGTAAGKLGVVAVAGAIVAIGVVVRMQASKLAAPAPEPPPAAAAQPHIAMEPPVSATATNTRPQAATNEDDDATWRTLAESKFGDHEALNTSLIEPDPGLKWSVRNGVGRFAGVTSDTRWAGNAVVLPVDQDDRAITEVSGDFMIAKSTGYQLVALWGRVASGSGGTDGPLCMFFEGSNGGGAYVIQTRWMNMPATVERGGGTMEGFGDETQRFHRMRMVVNRTDSRIIYFVDDKKVGSVKYEGEIDPITEVRLEIETPDKGTELEILFKDLKARSFGPIYR